LRGAVRALGEKPQLQIDVFVTPSLAAEDFGERFALRVTRPFRSLGHRIAWVQSVFPRLPPNYDAIFAPGNLLPLTVAGKTVLFVQNAHVVPQTVWRGEYRRSKRLLQRVMARMSIRRAGHVLFISRALKTWALPYWSRNRVEPGVAYPGITLGGIGPTDDGGACGTSGDVVMVGNLVPHKRVDLAIRAYGIVTRTRKKSGRLLIAGGEG